MVSVRKVDSLAALKALEKPWVDCLSRCSYRHLFLTHHWAVCWWTHFGTGHDLSVLLVEDGGELIAIAPMMVSRGMYGGLPVRTLGMMMTKHTSRAEFIISDGKREQAIRALVQYWEHHREDWDVVRFFHVPQQSGTMATLRSELERSRLTVFPVEESRRLLYLPLSGTWEEYCRQQSHYFRKNVRRCAEKAQAAGHIEVVVGSGAGEAASNMAGLFALEDHTWKANSVSAHLSSADRSFQIDLAGSSDNGIRYVNYFLQLNGTSIAGMHIIFYERICYGILLYCDERYTALSPGRYLMMHLLSTTLANRDSDEIDFNGNSDFFRVWSDKSYIAESISVCNARPYSRLISGLKQLKRHSWARPVTA